jgi:hypothetical protein
MLLLDLALIFSAAFGCAALLGIADALLRTFLRLRR